MVQLKLRSMVELTIRITFNTAKVLILTNTTRQAYMYYSLTTLRVCGKFNALDHLH